MLNHRYALESFGGTRLQEHLYGPDHPAAIGYDGQPIARRQVDIEEDSDPGMYHILTTPADRMDRETDYSLSLMAFSDNSLSSEAPEHSGFGTVSQTASFPNLSISEIGTSRSVDLASQGPSFITAVPLHQEANDATHAQPVAKVLIQPDSPQSFSAPATMYKCKMCGGLFSTQKDVMAHPRLHQSPRGPGYSCEFCHFLTVELTVFYNHLKIHFERAHEQPGSAPSLEFRKRKLKDVEGSDSPPDNGLNTGKFNQGLTYEVEGSDQLRQEERPLEENNMFDSTFLNKLLSEVQVICPKCDIIFRNQAVYDAHMALAHPPHTEMVNETSCKFPSMDKPELELNGSKSMKMNLVETENNLTVMLPTYGLHQCNQCRRRFLTEGLLKEHEITHEEFLDQSSITSSSCTEETEFMCPPEWEERYKCQKTWTAHMKDHVELTQTHNKSRDQTDITFSAKGKLECGLCGKNFKYPEALSAHLCTQEGNAETQNHTLDPSIDTLPSSTPQRIACSVCGKTYKYPKALSAHMKAHEELGKTRENPPEQKSDVTSESSTEEKSLQCVECGKQYYRQAMLDLHIKTQHTIPPVFLPTEGIRCKMCPLRFNNDAEFIEHRLFHFGESAVRCPECQKPFKNKVACRKHSKSHRKKRNETVSHQPFEESFRTDFDKEKSSGVELSLHESSSDESSFDSAQGLSPSTTLSMETENQILFDFVPAY